MLTSVVRPGTGKISIKAADVTIAELAARLAVTNINGGAGYADLFIYNTNWFGMLRSNTTSLSQVYISPNYVHSFNKKPKAGSGPAFGLAIS